MQYVPLTLGNNRGQNVTGYLTLGFKKTPPMIFVSAVAEAGR